MAYTAGCCSLKAQFIPLGIAFGSIWRHLWYITEQTYGNTESVCSMDAIGRLLSTKEASWVLSKPSKCIHISIVYNCGVIHLFYEHSIDTILECKAKEPFYWALYNNPSHSCISIGCCLWSIRGQTHDWRHHYKVFPSVVLNGGKICRKV